MNADFHDAWVTQVTPENKNERRRVLLWIDFFTDKLVFLCRTFFLCLLNVFSGRLSRASSGEADGLGFQSTEPAEKQNDFI